MPRLSQPLTTQVGRQVVVALLMASRIQARRCLTGTSSLDNPTIWCRPRLASKPTLMMYVGSPGVEGASQLSCVVFHALVCSLEHRHRHRSSRCLVLLARTPHRMCPFRAWISHCRGSSGLERCVCVRTHNGVVLPCCHTRRADVPLLCYVMTRWHW